MSFADLSLFVRMWPETFDPSIGVTSIAGLSPSVVLQIVVIPAQALGETSIHSSTTWMDVTKVGTSYSLE